MEKMISTRDIAKKFSVSLPTAKRWIKNLNLEVFKPSDGGMIFVNEKDFMKAIKTDYISEKDIGV